MRLYDVVVVLAPDESPEQTTAATEGFKKILTDGGANLVTEEPWGRRRLAYPIGKRKEGIYHYWQAEAGAETVAELDRRMKLSDSVLRHLIVRIDEEVRRSVKLKARREAKAARKPKKSPPPAPAEPAGPAEA
jgi:small subunit ribosomal protein S6